MNVTNEVVESRVAHNHPAQQPEEIEVQRLNNSMKRKAIEDVCERPSKIIHRELLAADSLYEVNVDSGHMACITKNIHRARSFHIPSLPPTLEALHAAFHVYDRRKTNKGEEFLLVNDSENHIVIFSTPQNLRFLCSCETILVEGTFKSAPTLFTQIFVIHGLQNDTYVPLVFSLLPDKTVESYAAVFRHIVHEANKLELFFAPARIYADFEESIHTAIYEVLVFSVVKGCRFHLG